MADENRIGKILITEEEIIKRAAEIGEQIVMDYAGEDLVLVGILRGAVVWMADIMKAVDMDISIDFIAVSSYGASTKSSGVVKINKDLDSDIKGKHVIIVEDIVDSGTTLNYLVEYLWHRGPKSVEICTLLDKPSRRRTHVDIKYSGFEVGDMFIIGYGLDYNQKYRNLPYISCLD